MTENPRDAVGNRRTRSQAAPEWTITESLILLNEIAAVEAECSVNFSSYQQWDIISQNCAALDVDRNLAQCRRKWRSLLAEYEDVRRRRRAWNSDRELFDAVERVVKGREERGEVDRESDGELGNEERDVTVEIDMIGTGFKRKRPRSKVERNSVQKPKKYWPVEPSENLKEKQDPEVIHEEVPENNHLEEVFLKDFLEKKPKLKSPAKRRPKHIEMPLQNLPEVEKHHDNEKPKLPEPASVGNITNNSREENEEMLTLKLQELAIEIQEISAESADCKEANTENIEDYRTEFTRRQGDKLIARLGNFSNTLKQLCDLLQECK